MSAALTATTVASPIASLCDDVLITVLTEWLEDPVSWCRCRVTCSHWYLLVFAEFRPNLSSQCIFRFCMQSLYLAGKTRWQLGEEDGEVGGAERGHHRERGENAPHQDENNSEGSIASRQEIANAISGWNETLAGFAETTCREAESVIEMHRPQAEELKQQLQSELDVVMPMCETAQRFLQCITQRCCAEFRSFARPPPAVLQMCDCLEDLMADRSSSCPYDPWSLGRSAHSPYNKCKLFLSPPSRFFGYTMEPSREWERDISIAAATKVFPIVEAQVVGPAAPARVFAAHNGFENIVDGMWLWMWAVCNYVIVAKKIEPELQELKTLEEKMRDGSANHNAIGSMQHQLKNARDQMFFEPYKALWVKGKWTAFNLIRQFEQEMNHLRTVEANKRIHATLVKQMEALEEEETQMRHDHHPSSICLTEEAEFAQLRLLENRAFCIAEMKANKRMQDEKFCRLSSGGATTQKQPAPTSSSRKKSKTPSPPPAPGAVTGTPLTVPVQNLNLQQLMVPTTAHSGPVVGKRKQKTVSLVSSSSSQSTSSLPPINNSKR